AGIGVGQLEPTLPSELTLTGALSDFSSFSVTDTEDPELLGPIGAPAFTNIVDTGANSGTVTIDYNFDETSIYPYDPPPAPPMPNDYSPPQFPPLPPRYD